ncbi:MAG: hypothetical protein IH905_11150 [Proteobacteria bacterium]|nr:hypothetical protein [Pseudomonadota bacterium]
MALKFLKLTRPNIRALKIGQKIAEHGITVQRLGDGDVRYSVNVMVDGERIHRVIGRASDGTTRTQCEEFIAKVRSDAKAGRLNLPRGRKTKLTFAAAAALYMRLLKESGGKGIVKKEQHFRLHLTPELGQMPLDRISTFTLEKCRKALNAKSLMPGTVNLAFATYRHMSNKLFEWGKIQAPLPMIRMEKADNRSEYVLSEEEGGVLGCRSRAVIGANNP